MHKSGSKKGVTSLQTDHVLDEETFGIAQGQEQVQRQPEPSREPGWRSRGSAPRLELLIPVHKEGSAQSLLGSDVLGAAGMTAQVPLVLEDLLAEACSLLWGHGVPGSLQKESFAADPHWKAHLQQLCIFPTGLFLKTAFLTEVHL